MQRRGQLRPLWKMSTVHRAPPLTIWTRIVKLDGASGTTTTMNRRLGRSKAAAAPEVGTQERSGEATTTDEADRLLA